MNLYRFILFSFCFLLLPLTADENAYNRYNTAWSMVFEQNKHTAFDRDFYNKVDKVDQELEALSAHLTENGMSYAWSPKVVRLGKLTCKIADKHIKTFQQLKVVDGQLTVGVPEIDRIFKKYEFNAFNRSQFVESIYQFAFGKSFNPVLVAQELSALNSYFEFAEQNSLFRMGGHSVLNRYTKHGSGIVIYSVRIGWGDCPAGCIYDNDTYFELRYKRIRDQERGEIRYQYIAKYLNNAGDTLENRARYFKNEAAK